MMHMKIENIKRCTKFAYLLVIINLVMCFGISFTMAQKSELVTDPDTGIILKVIAGSNRIAVMSEPSGGTKKYEMELLQPYYVIEESGDFYRITDLVANSLEEALEGNVGWVSKKQVYLWLTREALHFAAFKLRNRVAVEAWDSEKTAKNFLDTGKYKEYPPVFTEDIESTLERTAESRPYPVLGSQEVDFASATARKRLFEVLIPTSLPSVGGKLNFESSNDQEIAKEALTNVTVLIVFDATASMAPYAIETAKKINAAVNSSINKELANNARMGLIFYRDEADKSIGKSIEIYDPVSLSEAANKLENVEAASGADDAEPILDALYIATEYYNWDAGQSVQGARKVLIAVLNNDAKPLTTGGIDDRVPKGISPEDIARRIAEEHIVTITVQAGDEAGDLLKEVLQQVADITGGSFLSWENLDSLGSRIVRGLEEQVDIVSDEAEGLVDLPSIPLQALDAGKIEQLRRSGANFNIVPEEGGILVQEAWIPENNDLLQPQIKIENDTLLDLIALLNILARTSIDCGELLELASQSLATIVGEKFDRGQEIQGLIQKRLGIQFRSGLLDFKLEYLCGLTPNEKLAIQGRIQEGANRLADFQEANILEFDKTPSVWMPVAILP